MSRITEKFIRFGTGTDEVNSQSMPANFTPSTYTPDEVASEGTDKVSAHLKGIDNALISVPAGDISETSFSITNNQVVAASITGFAFANGTVRSFKAHVSVEVDATADLFEVLEIIGIQKGSDWDISVESTGDDSGVTFSITSAGQLQYISDSYTGFVSGDIKFRAITTSI